MATTSRERILAAMRREPVDHVPCAPLVDFQPEDQRWGRRRQFRFGPSDRQTLEYSVRHLGVDQVVQIGVGCCPGPEVTSRGWVEHDIIHRTWTTPSGDLHAAVRHDDRWLPGMDVPLFHDCDPSHFVAPYARSSRCLERPA